MNKHVEGVEHAVDIEWGGLNWDQYKVARAEAFRCRFRAKAWRVDNHQAAIDSLPACQFAGVFSCILNHGNTAKRPLTRGESRDRALGIRIDDCWMAPTKVPMDRKAARKCTFAAAALHGGDCDDRAHPSSVPGRKSGESSESMLSFSWLTAYCW